MKMLRTHNAKNGNERYDRFGACPVSMIFDSYEMDRADGQEVLFEAVKVAIGRALHQYNRETMCLLFTYLMGGKREELAQRSCMMPDALSLLKNRMLPKLRSWGQQALSEMDDDTYIPQDDSEVRAFLKECYRNLQKVC